MYENDLSYNFTAKKYGIRSPRTLPLWEEEFPLDTKSLSLSEEVINKVKSMRSKKEASAASKANQTREQVLESQIVSLRKALTYSELRNEGLLELLRIGKEEFGIDLLKKDGAKQ
jgi:hypothetical protein